MVIYILNRIAAIQSNSICEFSKPIIYNSEIKNIRIDLSKTNYIDSTTIGTFIQLKNSLEYCKVELLLCNLSPEIKKILEAFFTFLNKNNKT